jgi:hypothetical protein
VAKTKDYHLAHHHTKRLASNLEKFQPKKGTSSNDSTSVPNV